MATNSSTIDFLTEQLENAGDIRSRKMFGEYALYCNEKVIGLVCDDKLFIKPTDAGRKYIGAPTEAPPYPGAKNYFQISEDYWDDKEYLCALVEITTKSLPAKKK